MTRSLSPRPPQHADFEAAGLTSLFREDCGDALLAMTLASGGDERIAQGADGRNPYGAPIRPAGNEIWFASSTASAISQRGWDAAASALPLAFSAARAEDWHAQLRHRILSPLAPASADLVFCASGTQAEYAALIAARALDGAQPKTLFNLLVGSDETGRGAAHAASGKHFLDSAPFGAARKGRTIEGFGEGAINLASLPIRDPAGEPLAAGDIDAVAEFLTRHAVARNARALLHVLDCSKTGLTGFSRETAKKLKAAFPDHISVVVDACQLRCAPTTIRADLEAGFMVMISGSKFAGGPAFSGALLLPPDMMRALSRLPRILWPKGLAPHAALLDWPPALREKIAGPFGARCNQGLGLRWEAALAEHELYLAQAPEVSARAIALFGAEARKNIARAPALSLDKGAAMPTILPILSRSFTGAPLPAEPIQQALRARGMHVGQKVALGGGDVLRLCLSAPQINDFALRLASGMTEAAAFAPVAEDMVRLFDEWARLVAAI